MESAVKEIVKTLKEVRKKTSPGRMTMSLNKRSLKIQITTVKLKPDQKNKLEK